MSLAIIKLFGKSLPTSKPISFTSVNTISIPKGIIVHPSCCTLQVLDYIKTLPTNYNATFYKTWEDVKTRNRFELLLDQCQHYASTYGTGHEGEAWTMNDGTVVPFTEWKTIMPITEEEANDRCCEMLYSGIALSTDTLDLIFSVIKTVDINQVRNKEAMVKLCDKFNLLPSDSTEFVRYIVYKATGETLLIKDRKTIEMLKLSDLKIDRWVTKFGIEKLSSVFNRYKAIFLALKPKNKRVVNRLSKLSKKHHVPMQLGFFERLLSDETCLPDLDKRLETLNNYKKISLLQTILVRKKELDIKLYPIRNGKLWVEQNMSNLSTHTSNYYDDVFFKIYRSLVESVSKKATTIKLPKNIKLALPVSEKSFCGNLPFGTRILMGDADCIVGIHWRGEDGARDLDLSLMNIDGKKYGWNADFRSNNNDVVYSGDMTSANPEAVELFYARKGMRPAIVNVNLFSGDVGSKFKVFVASESISKLQRNYMVNPDNIICSFDSEMDTKQKSIGVLTGDTFVVSQFKTGNRAVKSNDGTDGMLDYTLKTLDCYLDLDTLLDYAGFEIVETDAEIDLTNLAKDTLISLLQN